MKRGPAARFTARDEEIFTRWKRGTSQTAMGRDYGVTVQRVHKIIQTQWARALEGEEENI